MNATRDVPQTREATGAPYERNAGQGELLQRKHMAYEEDSPATKKDPNDLRAALHGDMAQLRAELQGDMAQLRTEISAEMRGSMDHLREALVERMRDMQTEVLRAFHGWASPLEIRLRSLPNIEERLGLLEERVSTIERRDKLN